MTDARQAEQAIRKIAEGVRDLREYAEERGFDAEDEGQASVRRAPDTNYETARASRQPANISPDVWERAIEELRDRISTFSDDYPHSVITQCAGSIKVWLKAQAERPPE